MEALREWAVERSSTLGYLGLSFWLVVIWGLSSNRLIRIICGTLAGVCVAAALFVILLSREWHLIIGPGLTVILWAILDGIRKSAGMKDE